MTNRIYEFSCTVGHTTSRYIDEEVKVTTCKVCGEDSTRIISRGNFVLNRTFPSGDAKWLRQHESRGLK